MRLKNINSELAQTSLPNKPGVYYFSDKKNNILYIGKAKNLNKRTKYYFQEQRLCHRLRKMVSEAISLDYHITENENDAFLLEAQLIKQKQPTYNIQYKHGRTLSYILFTNHDYSQVKIIKKWEKNAIGPFLSYSNLKQTIDELLNFFQLRTCSDFTFKRRKKPCLEYYSKKCSAPCVNLINSLDYTKNVNKMKNVFLGNNKSVLKILEKDLKTSAKEEKFENAIKLVSTIAYIKKINEKQTIFFNDIKSLDIVIFYKNIFYLESIKNGAIVHIEYRKYIKRLFPEEILHEYYFEDANNRIIGEKKINFKNYDNVLTKEEKKILSATNSRFKNLLEEDQKKESWAATLGLEQMEIVEAYDCSHYNSNYALCGKIVETIDGEQLKNKYKIWKIDKKTYNDLEILKNGLERRCKEGDFPDLILIDGGKTQLKIAKETLYPYSKIIAYAKGDHRKGGIVYNYNEEEIIIKDQDLLFFLERLRTAAHNWVKNNAALKFSKTYNIA